MSHHVSFILPTEKELDRLRTEFVSRVSQENLKQLLEAFVTDGILNDLEKESILEENQSRADRVRCFIDTVKKKGDKACRIMFTHLQKIDSTLYSSLHVSTFPSAQKGKNLVFLSCYRNAYFNYHVPQRNVYY